MRRGLHFSLSFPHSDFDYSAQALLEILIAGGLLAPGGSIQQDGDKGPVSTSACIFQVGFESHTGVYLY